MIMDKKDVEIHPILNEVIENMQLKNSDLEVTIHSDKSYIIQADVFHFTNIIYNLLDNSIKYCNEHPKIDIKITEDSKNLKLEFTDNGIGILNKNINFIFDKFYRIPSLKSNEVNGFGLGLYYVKKICLQHNWKISATNNTEKGITISIIIPNK